MSISSTPTFSPYSANVVSGRGTVNEKIRHPLDILAVESCLRLLFQESNLGEEFLSKMRRNVLKRKRPPIMLDGAKVMCIICQDTRPPEWRKGPQNITLCNACGVAYAKATKYVDGFDIESKRVEKTKKNQHT